ncbi:hypothetical protein NE619_16505 [Anaerovorax odorimutans]|uniref:Uncharacterized protein n=1 Tax=Anaerovorax odorimutans TaxID=109327 RepID=A0ABT1RT82_9FIRM|nr:hypothetical protein [Anaerovorax odorimutans]
MNKFAFLDCFTPGIVRNFNTIPEKYVHKATLEGHLEYKMEKSLFDDFTPGKYFPHRLPEQTARLQKTLVFRARL